MFRIAKSLFLHQSVLIYIKKTTDGTDAIKKIFVSIFKIIKLLVATDSNQSHLLCFKLYSDYHYV